MPLIANKDDEYYWSNAHSSLLWWCL